MTSDSEGSVGWTQIAGSSIESPLVCTGTVSALDGTNVGAANTTSTGAVVTTVTPAATTASVATARIALICPPPVLTNSSREVEPGPDKANATTAVWTSHPNKHGTNRRDDLPHDRIQTTRVS